MIVPNKLTRLRPQDAAAALAAAYEQLTGIAPAQPVLGLLIAQSALETADWQSIHNFNFGNQKAGSSYPMIVQFRCSEIVNGVEQFYEPPAPECNFRAYETSASGALDYLRVLRGREHWWQGLHTGDPSAFVDALATPPRYFTASPALYKRVLIERLEQYGSLAEGALNRQAQRPELPPTFLAAPTLPVLSADWRSRSASGSLPSAFSWPPSEGHADEPSGVRSLVTWRDSGAASPATQGHAIELASAPSLLAHLFGFIDRLFARLFGRGPA